MLDTLIRREKRLVLLGASGFLAAFAMWISALLFFGPLVGRREEAAGFVCCCSAGLLPLVLLLAALIGRNYAPESTNNRLITLLFQYGKIKQVIKQIDSEVESGKQTQIRGSLPGALRGLGNRCAIISESWLIIFEPEDFWIVRISDILWAFKRIIARPTRWTGERLIFQVCCVMNVDRVYCIPLPNEAWADEVLQMLVKRRPEVLFGYHGEWRDLAANGRAAMGAEIARRRNEWYALDEEGRDEWRMDRLDEAENFVRRVDPFAPSDGGVHFPPD
jgi:hypothetical protein